MKVRLEQPAGPYSFTYQVEYDSETNYINLGDNLGSTNLPIHRNLWPGFFDMLSTLNGLIERPDDGKPLELTSVFLPIDAVTQLIERVWSEQLSKNVIEKISTEFDLSGMEIWLDGVRVEPKSLVVERTIDDEDGV